MDYFKNLQDLLHLERMEDRKTFQQLSESTSVADRRANGITWYPVAIRGSEIARGDYLCVELERTTHQDVSHQLRFGVAAMLFSNHDPKNHKTEGTITHISGSRLKLTLRTDELPEWAGEGKLGVDLLFDDNSYDEMRSALQYAGDLAEKPEGRLVQVLSGQKQPAFDPQADMTVIDRLNARQNEAVQRIVAANDVAIVHGPPGTGKTTTLVQAIKTMLARDNQQILVVAPSNTAVDLLSEKLSEEGLNVLRVGNPARVSERLMALTLDSKMGQHPAMKEIKQAKKRAGEFRNMAHKYKRSFGKAERDQRKALFDEAHRIMKDVEQTEQYIINDLIGRAQVIAATLVGASHYTVRHLKYHTVVIDEAGQAIEPGCWIPIVKAQKVILAGDHCQLPPTIKSNEAARKGLATTLLEKCCALYPQAVVLLEEQYRMHRQIMGYSSTVFYRDKLIAHPSVAGHLLFDGDAPLEFVDTAGCGFDEKQDGTSTTNPEEAAMLLKHLARLVGELSTRYNRHNFPSVAVISPYKQQVAVLSELMVHVTELKLWSAHIAVNTIDSFQGQERDVVYLSMVRSNADGTIGFLNDIRRMNVAMTRARKKLVITGDSATLSQLPFYAALIAYAEKHNAYHSAWEYMDI